MKKLSIFPDMSKNPPIFRHFLSLLTLLSLLPSSQAYFTASDGYNLMIYVVSILTGVILIGLLFCLIYYFWLKRLLTDWRQDHRGYVEEKEYQQQQRGYGKPGYGGGGSSLFGKKKQLISEYDRRYEPEMVVVEPPGSKSSPTRFSGADTYSAGGYGGGGAYPGGPGIEGSSPLGGRRPLTSSYDRSATVRLSPGQLRRSSPSPTRHVTTTTTSILRQPTLSQAAQEIIDSSMESRHSPTAPLHERLYGHRRTEYDPSARSVPYSGSRPGSALSTHSHSPGGGATKYTVTTTGSGLRTAAPDVGRSDSGTGGSITYQATYSQRVTGRNPSAYFGSSV